jgi:hypothetical protein
MLLMVRVVYELFLPRLDITDDIGDNKLTQLIPKMNNTLNLPQGYILH